MLLDIFKFLGHAVIPRFLRMLKDVEIKETEDAHFSCAVYPDNAPAQWYISGRQVMRTTKYLPSLNGPERQLVIKGATKGDEGRVSVKIGDDVQSYADLSVEGMLLLTLTTLALLTLATLAFFRLRLRQKYFMVLLG